MAETYKPLFFRDLWSGGCLGGVGVGDCFYGGDKLSGVQRINKSMTCPTPISSLSVGDLSDGVQRINESMTRPTPIGKSTGVQRISKVLLALLRNLSNYESSNYELSNYELSYCYLSHYERVTMNKKLLLLPGMRLKTLHTSIFGPTDSRRLVL